MSDQSDQRPIQMSSGLPSTVIPAADPRVREALAQAIASNDPRSAIAEVVAEHPRLLEGWAALGDHGRDVIERYAAYRVGYHRGLDALRANGWRGSGYVRWNVARQPGLPPVPARARCRGSRDRRVRRGRAMQPVSAPARSLRSARRAVTPVGVVLTGGRSSRMGVDKSLLPVGGVAMAKMVADALAGGGCEPIVCQGGDVEALAALGLSTRPTANRVAGR